MTPTLRFCAGAVLQAFELSPSHSPPLLLPIPSPSPFPKFQDMRNLFAGKSARGVPTQSCIFNGINLPTLMGSDGGWVFAMDVTRGDIMSVTHFIGGPHGLVTSSA